jgi:hypothetical protein
MGEELTLGTTLDVENCMRVSTGFTSFPSTSVVWYLIR